MIPAMSEAPEPKPYDPTPDVQALIDIINELLPQDKPRTRSLLAQAASVHAGNIAANWPKA